MLLKHMSVAAALFLSIPAIGFATSSTVALDACTPLSGAEIQARFANVVDHAQVQDGQGGSATNRWYADGRMISRWQTQQGSGALRGRWWIEGDQRCVAIDSALPDGSPQRRCGMLAICGDRIASTNARGQIHGLHQLSPMPRSLALSGTHHTRDLGGYRTQDGRITRFGVAFRSDHLGDLTTTDQRTLEALGIERVYDLRSSAEQAHRPTASSDAWSPVIQSVDVNDPKLDTASLGRRIFNGQAGADELRRLLRRDALVLQPERRQAWAGWLRDLSRGETPMLFHCTAGKDRTGMAAALLLLALGVPVETARADFLLSNTLLQAKIDQQIEHVRSSGVVTNETLLREVLGVSARSFDDALAAIHREYGSFDRYLHEGLGLGESDIAALRDRFLEPG